MTRTKRASSELLISDNIKVVATENSYDVYHQRIGKKGPTWGSARYYSTLHAALLSLVNEDSVVAETAQELISKLQEIEANIIQAIRAAGVNIPTKSPGTLIGKKQIKDPPITISKIEVDTPPKKKKPVKEKKKRGRPRKNPS